MNRSGIISDGMVLQRHAPVPIWGRAKPNQPIEVHFLGRCYPAVADDAGNWSVTLDEMEAGGPHQMVISVQGEPDVTIENILVGDVWLLGGQSNMQLPVRRTLDLFADEVADVELPTIRQFTVPERYDFHGPRAELAGGRWMPATGDNVLDFSAVGFFFARELQRTIDVPIGLILTAIGGTPVEAWMSESTLKRFGGYDETLAQCKDDRYVNETIRRDEERRERWMRELNEHDAGIREKWYLDDRADGPEWQAVQVPGRWNEPELADAHGAVWYRKTFEVQADMLGSDAKLMLGTVVDADDTFINGVWIGSTAYRYPPRRYVIPRKLLKPGTNRIAVRVVSIANKGGFIPDMPYKIVADGKEIDLTGTWCRRIGVLKEAMQPTTFFQYKPAGLYNGMIAPISRYRIKGTLWYQGESNTGQPRGYADLFRAMIQDWRKRWGIGDFPFIYTQLANFEGDEDHGGASRSNWAELREEQRLALDVPNTAMAVTIDVGEYNDLHPQDKKTVGERLALCARKRAYGEEIVYSGPLFAGIKKEGDAIRLHFDHVGSGLVAWGDGVLRGFELRGEEGDYMPARAVIDGKTVLVTNEHIPNPCQVRYAWANNPADANLYNREGLPASPFEGTILA